MPRNRDDRLFTTGEIILSAGITLTMIGLIGLGVLACLGAFPT